MSSNDEFQVSLRLPMSWVSDFDRIAEILGRDRAWVMQHALSRYLAHEGAEILDDAAGLAQLDQGKAVDLDDVLQKARSITAAAENHQGKRAG